MNTPAAQVLAHALLHSLWEDALIAVLLAAILQLGRSKSALLRYALACAALFTMPLAFVVTLWLLLPGASTAVIAPPFPTSLLTLHAAGNLPSLPEPAQSPLLWLVPLWMTGVAGFYAYGVAGWIAAQRLRCVGVCAASAVWQERLGSLATRLRVSRHVILLESCLANTPVVVGVLRPVILAPLGILTGLPTGQVESILIHELAHIRRHDYLVNLAQRLVEGLFFYHPAVWWISNLVRTEREFCCDDLVVELSGDPRSYAQALSTLEQRRWTATQTALAANGGNLMTRIRRLLHQQDGPRIAAGPVAGLLLLLACAALVAWQPDRPRQAPVPVAVAPMPMAQTQSDRPRLMAQAKSLPRPSVPAPPAAAQLPDPYQKWLNEEAIYIITDDERAAFGRLATDEQRQQFIQEFWKRRDPTPDTDKNEFREELYRRIQYANDHFAGAQAGWMSDRGKTYIRYGPPDQIEDHPGAADALPSQIWQYRHIDGIGEDVKLEFVDSNRKGDYRLTVDPNRIAQGPVVIRKIYKGSQKTFYFLSYEQFRKQTRQDAVFEINADTGFPVPRPAR